MVYLVCKQKRNVNKLASGNKESTVEKRIRLFTYK